MKSLIPDWLPKLFVKAEGSVREATTKKFSDFNKITDTEGMEVVGIKDGANVRADFVVAGEAGEVTTSMVGLEPDDPLRNVKGQFMPTKELPELTNQKDANRFIASELQRLDQEIEGIEAGGGEVDLSDYATIQYVDETELNVLNAAIKVAQDGDAVLQEQIDNIDVPEGVDLTGYATEAWVGEQGYATEEYVDQTELDVLNAAIKVAQDGDAVLQAQIDAIDIPDGVDLEGYATEEWVTEQIDAIPETDLEDYATTAQLTEVDNASVFRDEALKAQADEWDVLNTAAHLKLEDQILRSYAWSQGDNESLERQLTKVDEGLQAQIDVIEDTFATEVYVDDAIAAIDIDGVDGYAKKADVDAADAALQDQIDVNKMQSEEGDKHLQVEIEEIALALETLLVQREHGQWKYIGFTGDNMPRNAGEFSLASDDLSASQNIITLNQEDLKGTTHGFGDVEVGDYLEIVDLDEPNNYVLFVVDGVPEGTGIVNVNVSLKDKGQNFLVGETCEVRFFALNEQDINLTDLDNRYLRLSGGTMTGILELPRFNVKKHDGEAIALIEGMTEGNATSARLTFSNKINANAYGNLTWNGNSGQGWFQFNKDVDFSSKNLHSVNNIRLSGAKTIQEGTNTRIQLDNKVVIYKPGANGANRAGFVLKGATDQGNDGDLLNAYHNSSGLDAVNYQGRTTAGSKNLATCEYVDDAVENAIGNAPAPSGGSTASAKIQTGIQMWQESRLVEGCFNLVDENQQTTSNCKFARGLTFHTYTSYDAWPWMQWGLRSGGQIHLTDMNGKYLMSKPVLSVEKRDSGSGANPTDALWFFELSIYGYEAETSLSGLYMVEFENCLEAS